MHTVSHRQRRLLALAAAVAVAALAGCQKTTTTTPAPNGGTTTTTTIGTAPIPDLSASAAVAVDRAAVGASQALGVAGAKVDDAAVTMKVKTALMAAAEVKAMKIDVDTKDGRVTLSGMQESTAAIERAVAVARGTDGVVGVENKLAVGAR